MQRTTKRTTPQRFQKLVSLMENHPNIARGMGSFGSTKQSRAKLWEKFATELNAIGSPMRNGREWNKVWLDYKLKLKKKIATNRRGTTPTGGGPYTQQSLTPLERIVDELLHLQETVNPTASSFGTRVEETAVSSNESYPEEPLAEVGPPNEDVLPRSLTPRPRMTVDDRENIRIRGLEKQADVQDTLCQRLANIKKLEEIAKYTRRTYDLKKEEINFLKLKEERKRQAILEKRRQQMEITLKELELRTLKYNQK